MKTTKEMRAWYLKRLDIMQRLGESQMGIEIEIPTEQELREYLHDYANETALLFERHLIADVDDAVKLLDAARDANTQAYHNPPCEECLGCRLRTFLKELDA